MSTVTTTTIAGFLASSSYGGDYVIADTAANFAALTASDVAAIGAANVPVMLDVAADAVSVSPPQVDALNSAGIAFTAADTLTLLGTTGDIAVLDGLIDNLPGAGVDVVDVVVTLDNYAAHKHEKVRPAQSPSPLDVPLHTTASSSLNAVDGFFAIRTHRRLQNGVFRSTVDLQDAMNRFNGEHNQEPKPFVLRADPGAIIATRNLSISASPRAVRTERDILRKHHLIPFG